MGNSHGRHDLERWESHGGTHRSAQAVKVSSRSTATAMTRDHDGFFKGLNWNPEM